jgi:acyl dehydratase
VHRTEAWLPVHTSEPGTTAQSSAVFLLRNRSPSTVSVAPAVPPRGEALQVLLGLGALAGQPISTSDWVTITQAQINQFAQATGDHQWIHIDEQRAKAGPFGAPIAHGFLTLSLIPLFFASAIHIEQTRMGVNYGLNRVRFTGPVPVGSRVRASIKLLRADAVENGGFQFTWEVSTEREGTAKPVCVAESISRLYP